VKSADGQYFYQSEIENLKRVRMMTASEKTMMYETLLSTPGMAENVKLPGSASRKLVLLFSLAIERELVEGSELFSFFPKAMAADLDGFIKECLEKAGLTDFHQKLKALK
jgi:hypothetical protein